MSCQNVEMKKGTRDVGFVVSLGGLDSETFDSASSSFSPQLRTVPIGTTLNIVDDVVPSGTVLVMREVCYKMFSEQARQDLRVSLLVGNQAVHYNGKVLPASASPGELLQPVSEVRLLNTQGSPLNTLTSVAGAGYPDGYAPFLTRNFAVAFERDAVIFRVQNQSIVYAHPIMVWIYGWRLSAKGRTREEILKQIVGE